MNTIKYERGQVLVIFAIALVGLLGLVSLAIDGSMIYSDRRFDQNAADSAALAGASAASMALSNGTTYAWNNFDCGDIDPVKTASVAKAVERAAANKFTITEQNLDSANHGVQIQCVNTSTDKMLLVRVKITSTVSTGFAHLFFGGAIKNTVEGVARVIPRKPMAFGNAIVAMDPNCNYDGINFSGNTSVNAYEGGIFSNSCMTKNGGSGGIYVPDAGVNYHTTFSGSTGPFTPNNAKPDHSDAVVTLPALPTPNCNALPDYRGTSPSANLTPGRYDGMTGNRFLAPGLYCFYGDISLSGSHNVFHGDNVTIYFDSGGFKITGNGDIQLSASPSKTPAGNALQDIVILMKPGNTSELKIDGNANSYFSGLILAPNQSIDLGGCESTEAYHAQVVGRNIKFHGNPAVNVTFYNSERFMTPVLLEMYK